jgi:predicted permease
MDRALRTPLGIQPQGAMLVDLDLSQVGQQGDAAVEQAGVRQAMIAALCAIPGVTAAGAVNRTPMTGGIHGIPIFMPGTTEFKLNNSVLASYVFQMSPGYLEAAGTRLLGGREISWHDTAKTPHVAIVNETFARKMWAKLPALGQHFIVSGNLAEVVGVVEDGKYHDLQESPQPVVYLPLTQSAQSETVFVVRSRRSSGEMAAALEHTLRSVAPNVPSSVQNWPDVLESELLPARAATVALGVMGLLAAMLALTGIFGMAAYGVSRRMKELGIRVALGASKTQVMRAALGRPMALLGVGSVLGLLAGIAASRLLEHIVYQANPSDPAVMGGAVLTMAMLGVAASALPARRALALDPSQLMRDE